MLKWKIKDFFCLYYCISEKSLLKVQYVIFERVSRPELMSYFKRQQNNSESQYCHVKDLAMFLIRRFCFLFFSVPEMTCAPAHIYVLNK